MRRGLTIAAAVLVTALVAAAYGPAVDTAAGFVSDDFMILQRVRDAGGLAGAGTYFSQSYYEYYRPLGFLMFAADWTWWGADARASHAVSVLLHVLNTLLVLVLAARLAGLRAGVIAAALFGVHVAHHEAVYWFAARFDLLATAGVLAALVALTSRHRASTALAGLFFFAALLAKESAVTFPIVAAAAVLLIQGGSVRRVGRVLLWLGALAAVYVVMRQASGLPSMGGAARLPKLAALGALPLLLLAAAHPAAQPLLGWVRRRAWWWGAGVALAAAAAFWASSAQPGAGALRGALAAAGFAAAHTFSPVALDQALMPLPSWLAAVGTVAVALAALVGSAVCRSRVPAFLMWFALAAYIPVSSMTEGTRY
ncbi:hypothetical protein FJ250_06985, partial [bacterium]|nr:hypothetical protein [bacterium]